MAFCVISGDIISSTSLKQSEREELIRSLEKLTADLSQNFHVFSRILKGDYLECVVPSPGEGLRIALILKCFIKKNAAQMTGESSEANRLKYFKTHGIRLAVGYGGLSKFDRENDIIDGEAIYLSGRELSGESTYNKDRLVIKNSLFFASGDEALNQAMNPIFGLLDVILVKATARQCEVLYLKLMGRSETEIAEALNIGQSAVNQHSTGAGWNAIEAAVNYFDNRLSNL